MPGVAFRHFGRNKRHSIPRARHLNFTENGAANGLGMFLDSVNVDRVLEPGTMGLTLAASGLLAWYGRRRSFREAPPLA